MKNILFVVCVLIAMSDRENMLAYIRWTRRQLQISRMRLRERMINDILEMLRPEE